MKRSYVTDSAVHAWSDQAEAVPARSRIGSQFTVSGMAVTGARPLLRTASATAVGMATIRICCMISSRVWFDSEHRCLLSMAHIVIEHASNGYPLLALNSEGTMPVACQKCSRVARVPKSFHEKAANPSCQDLDEARDVNSRSGSVNPRFCK